MKRLFAILSGMLLVSGVALAQDAEISPELEAEMQSLEAAAEEIRELDGEPVVRDFPTRDEVIEYLRETIDTQLPLEEAERYQRFYVALGLMEPDVNLRDVYLELLGAQVAGFYDSDTKMMNVIPTSGLLSDDLTLTEEIIYVHEFTHALQDQFFGLDPLIEPEEIAKHPDRALAAISLVEGDATAVMQVYVQNVVSRNPMAAFQILGEGLQAGNLFLPPDTPEILTKELLFPYEGGMLFILALYEAGGWEQVNAAYENPPVTSEHILHPDTYLAGEQPADVTLADTAGTLGSEWTQSWDTRLGEWYLREHLRTQLESDETREAAAGWGGDRFHLYHNAETDELAWVLRLAWDSAADAGEFEVAYAQWGDTAFGTAQTDSCWQGAGQAACLSRVGDDVVVAHAPTPEQAMALIDAQ